MQSMRKLLDLLGIDVPVIQAPMAGASSAELVAAVANAGGLGSYGCSRLSPAQVYNAMATTALDSMAPGIDRDSGHGIVMALPAVQYAQTH